MKAVYIQEIDAKIQVIDLPDPKPQNGEKKYKVLYSALNHRDLYISRGQYAKIVWPVIPGSDACVLDEEDGQTYILNPGKDWGDNTRVQGRDYQILGMPGQGTFAEYICVNPVQCFKKPAHLSNAEAAALPLGGLTAYRALFTRARAEAGEKVLISGIGGGVALFAMQFAIAQGCEVYVTSSSPEKIKQAIEMGAKGGFLYNQPDWEQACLAQKTAFDVIIDSAGGTGFSKLLALAAPGARIAIYGGTCGKLSEISPQLLFWKQISILGSSMGNENDFAEMLDFVEKNKIKPFISAQFKLDDAAMAFAMMDKGQQFGKIVISHT